MFFKKKNSIIAGYLLFLQLFFPAFSCLSSVTEVIERGGTAKMAAEKNKSSSLPDLGSAETLSEEKQKKKLAFSAKQWGSILSSDNVTSTSADYVKSLGASLASEYINHWLNRYGTARFSIGTDRKIAGDLLLPVIDNARNLFFMQLGLRTNPDRNTTNLGLGYRQSWQNWMYGINTFYDYDYTGNNARFGVGLEALTDYLKFATNGYFGLTKWHRSKLSSMNNYDERPATGFDLRAEAYLPAYPQLGARIKYAKYFGKGIELATQAAFDQLKDNPQSLTLGLSYTPIPLLTLTGDRTIGDRSDTKIGLDVMYYFGVPLLQQLDIHAVDKMRYLDSNKYDFVARNDDIVMQYSKQRVTPLVVDRSARIADGDFTVIADNQPANGRAQNQLKAVVTNSQGNKLRGIAVMFSADNGAIPAGATVTTNGAGEALFSVASTRAGKTTVMAKVGDQTVQQMVNFVVDKGSARIADGDFTVITDNQPANGRAENQLKVVVTNSQGDKLQGIAVMFNADNSTIPAGATAITNEAGEALFSVASLRAGKIKVTAKVGDQTVQQTVNFVVDKGSARIADGDFTVITDNQPANGRAQNQLKAVVTNSQGNKLQGITVTFSADGGAIPAGATAITNEAGEALFSVASIQLGKTTVTAKVGDQTVQQTVNFVMDKGSEQPGNNYFDDKHSRF